MVQLLSFSFLRFQGVKKISRLRRFTSLNYEEKVRDTLEETIIDRISQQLNFSSIWAYPVRSAPFSTIVRNLLNEAEATDRLAYLADMYL